MFRGKLEIPREGSWLPSNHFDSKKDAITFNFQSNEPSPKFLQQLFHTKFYRKKNIYWMLIAKCITCYGAKGSIKKGIPFWKFFNLYWRKSEKKTIQSLPSKFWKMTFLYLCLKKSLLAPIFTNWFPWSPGKSTLIK